MIKYAFVLLSAVLLATKVNGDANDDAAEQLQTLRDSVTGAILAAQDSLEELSTDAASTNFNIIETAAVDIQEEKERIDSELTTLKDLAAEEDKDIFICLDLPGQVLDNLPDIYTAGLRSCVAQTDSEGAEVLTAAQYHVDIYINRVDYLDFQLGRCGPDDANCVQVVIDLIKTDSVQLPQDIRSEVTNAAQLYEIIRQTVQICSDKNIAGYASEANTILSDIADCANDA